MHFYIVLSCFVVSTAYIVLVIDSSRIGKCASLLKLDLYCFNSSLCGLLSHCTKPPPPALLLLLIPLMYVIENLLISPR